MKKKTKLMLAILICPIAIHAQIRLGQFKPSYNAEVFLGGSTSFSYGKFINEHKEFHEVSFSDADISGKIKPIIFFDAGGQFRVVLGEEDLLSFFSVSMGAFYSKRGFTHLYSYSSDNSAQNINDEMSYTEKYRINQISIPILIRYGKKWFIEIGPSFDHFISATRKQILKREISGSGAYDGGFSTTETNQDNLNKNLFNEHKAGFILGLGTTLGDRFSVRLTNHIFAKAYDKGSNYKSYNLQLEIMYNLFKLNNNE